MIKYELKKVENYTDGFNKLYEILSLLRSPEGCPWDRKVTAQSSVMNMKSELLEVLDELNSDNKEGIEEEVGDVLLNAIMLLIILEETKNIKPETILDKVCKKLVERHPHVFTDTIKVEDSSQALQSWNKMKEKEGKKEDEDDFFSRIPSSCNTYERAEEVLHRAISAGFTWENVGDVLDQTSSEIEEVREETKKGVINNNSLNMEIGDLIFSSLAVAQYQKISSEMCLNLALKKFEKRFNCLRKEARKDGINIEKGSKVPLDVLDRYWKKAKLQTKDME